MNMDQILHPKFRSSHPSSQTFLFFKSDISKDKLYGSCERFYILIHEKPVALNTEVIVITDPIINNQ